MEITTGNFVSKKCEYTTIGPVFGNVIYGANIIRDFTANIRDNIGGRVNGYEDVIKKAQQAALCEIEKQAVNLQANAIIGLKMDIEYLGRTGSMIMVSLMGTAIKFNNQTL